MCVPPRCCLQSHAKLCSDISAIARRVQSDQQLREQISYKYRMKNTVGLSLNALVDFDPGACISRPGG
jgi:D-lactate dehydrogenase